MAGVLISGCGTAIAEAPPPTSAPVILPTTITTTRIAIAAQPTVTDTLLPPPTATPTAIPTATSITLPTPPASPELRQLAEGGCCVQPFFSPDSQQVLFIDKPNLEAPVGIYGIDLTNPQATPELINDLIGFRSPDRTIVATMDGDFARFVNEATGENWSINTSGNWPRYSPNAQHILWEARDREGPFDARQTDIWLADLRGNDPQIIATVRGGGFVGWLPNNQRVVLTTRPVPGEEIQTLSVLDVTTGEQIEVAREKRIRGIEISSDGSWIAFFVTFSDTLGNSGIWVVNPDGTILQQLNVPAFGAYQWRDDTTLLHIPIRQSIEESLQLWRVDVLANESRPLTDPERLTFSISNGDWQVSPDGQKVVFVNSADQNLWLLNLNNMP